LILPPRSSPASSVETLSASEYDAARVSMTAATGKSTSSEDAPTGRAPWLTIVIPVFNDEEVIGQTLGVVEAFVEACEPWVEVVVVDDGSTDATAQVVERLAMERQWLRMLKLGRNRGKGAAVRAGALAATGDRVLFSDADLSTPLAEVDKLLERIEAGYDVAIGSRALPESQVPVRQWILRERAGKTFNVLVRWLVLPAFRDTQCGFKCFSQSAAREVFALQRATGFEFDVELLCIAQELGLRVAEVPIVWRNHPTSHVRFVRDSGRMFLGLLRIWRRYPRRRIVHEWMGRTREETES